MANVDAPALESESPLHGIATRFHLFLDEGSIRRVPQRIAYEMPFGRDAIPEYAGTRQRVASVLVESEGGRPARILDARGRSGSSMPRAGSTTT